jgi:uncharacterized protein (TIGR01777 family)
MHVIISGGSGLIGRALTDSLTADGHRVTILSRSPGNAIHLPEGAAAIYWDGKTVGEWAAAIEEADAVVDLAGESIGGSGYFDIRWTPARRRRILESRTQPGHALVEAIQAAGHKPDVFIQASAVGYYGTETGDADVTEDFAAGNDFAARVCVEWEQATAPVKKLGVRRVVTRTGVVLSTRSGALPRQMLPFKLFAGGPIGTGRQWYPWVHLADEVGAMRFLIDHQDAEGAFNVVAPDALTNAEFGQALAGALHRPYYLPVPAFALKLAYGDAAEMLLEGQKAVPARLQELGYEFQFPEAQPAVEDLLATGR